MKYYISLLLLFSMCVCSAKTVLVQLTPKQLQDMAVDRYIDIPTQVWKFVNNTKQPMIVSLIPVERDANKWLSPYVTGAFVQVTPEIKPGEQYTMQYQHMSPTISEMKVEFKGKGKLSTCNVGDIAGIDAINNAPEGIFTFTDIGINIPSIKIQ